MQHIKLNKPDAFPLFSLMTLYVTDVLTRMYTSCPGTSITLSRTTIFTCAGATFWRYEVRKTMLGLVIDTFTTQFQGCGLGKILRNHKVPSHEILGSQHLSRYESSQLLFSSLNSKVGHLWHSGTPRAQAVNDLFFFPFHFSLWGRNWVWPLTSWKPQAILRVVSPNHQWTWLIRTR